MSRDERRAVSSRAPLQNLLACLLEVAARDCESSYHMGIFILGGIGMSPRILKCVGWTRAMPLSVQPKCHEGDQDM